MQCELMTFGQLTVWPKYAGNFIIFHGNLQNTDRLNAQLGNYDLFSMELVFRRLTQG